MEGEARFLLITGIQSAHWRKTLKSALIPLGALDVAEQDQALVEIEHGDYDLIFIDATAVVESVEMVEAIRRQDRDLPIIVAAASPDWEQAREVLRAGASDYVRKSHDEQELLSVVRAVLNWPLRSEP